MATALQRLSDNQEYVLGKIYALESATVRALFEQYRQAYQRMKTALETIWGQYVQGDTWSAEDAFFRGRTETLMQQILGEMQALTGLSQEQILEAVEDSWRAGLVGGAYTLEELGLVVVDMRLPLLPKEAIRAQILAPYEGNTFLDRFVDNRLDFERRIRGALIQSQIEGEGIYKVQKRLAEALGIDISRRTSAAKRAHQKHFYRTQMIARTEILRASNLGALAIYRENADVLRGYEWRTAMDERVCPQCAPLDGRVFDFEGKPIDGKGQTSASLPPAHPQCRCAAIPALLDEDLERRLTGKRKTFLQWAEEKGLTRNVYGQAFDLRGQPAPRLEQVA